MTVIFGRVAVKASPSELTRAEYLDPDDAGRSRWQRVRALRRAINHYRPTVVLAQSALPRVTSGSR